MSPLMAPSTINGAVRPLVRKPATKVEVFQCPCGTAATNRCPGGAIPPRHIGGGPGLVDEDQPVGV